jgi:O-antigen/teichoic acid export membrane protein
VNDATTETAAASPQGVGHAERHIARGALLQQVSQVWGTLCMLLVATVLGRHLGKTEFGVYGLLISLVAYLVTAQVSVEGAAIRALAAAETKHAKTRSEAFSTTMSIYAVGGVVAGGLVAIGGVALIGVIGVPEDLKGDVKDAILGLALVTAVGWPFKAFQDALRAAQLFGAAAMGEMAAYTTVAVGMTAGVVLGAPLWVLITIGGSLSALVGLWSSVALVYFKVGHRFRAGDVRRALAWDMLGMSAYLFAAGLADLVIYSLDRVILSAFRPLSQVGLYEGAVRPHNLLRQLHGTLVLTVVPVAAGLFAEDNLEQLRDLFVRGTRYVVAIVAPATIVLVVLAAPLLEIWLGPAYREGGLALAVFSCYWIVGANTGVASSMLVAAGEVRIVARYAWCVAIANLALSLALTPSLGLMGVVLGTTIPNFIGVPFLIAICLHRFPVKLADLAREVWLPAYSICIPLTIVMVVIRLFAEPQNVLELGLAGTLPLLGAWALYWIFWMRPGERRLVRSFVPFLGPKGSA